MSNIGILLIHGFAGTRDEIKPLYDYLCKQGYTVSMPILSGHEGSKKELASAKYHQWVSSAQNAFLKLKETCDQIIVIGFSMGGLVAVNLYQQQQFDLLVTVNTPFYYWDLRRIFENLKSDFATYFKKYFTASTDKPFPALLEFQKLLSHTKPLLKTIKCPSMVMQTEDDDTVNPKSAEAIFSRLKCEKFIKKYPKGGHIVFQNENCSEILEAINHFIKKI